MKQIFKPFFIRYGRMGKTKGFIEPKGSKRDFEGGFFGISSTLIDAHTLPGQTEGLKGWLRR